MNRPIHAAAVLVVFGLTLLTPAAAAASCCPGATAAEHAQMSCCATSCEMRAADPARDTDRAAAVVTANSVRLAPGTSTMVPAFGQVTTFLPAAAQNEPAFSSPPVFLLDEQFRI